MSRTPLQELPLDRFAHAAADAPFKPLSLLPLKRPAGAPSPGALLSPAKRRLLGVGRSPERAAASPLGPSPRTPAGTAPALRGAGTPSRRLEFALAPPALAAPPPLPTPPSPAAPALAPSPVMREAAIASAIGAGLESARPERPLCAPPAPIFSAMQPPRSPHYPGFETFADRPLFASPRTAGRMYVDDELAVGEVEKENVPTHRRTKRLSSLSAPAPAPFGTHHA